MLGRRSGDIGSAIANRLSRIGLQGVACSSLWSRVDGWSRFARRHRCQHASVAAVPSALVFNTHDLLSDTFSGCVLLTSACLSRLQADLSQSPYARFPECSQLRAHGRGAELGRAAVALRFGAPLTIYIHSASLGLARVGSAPCVGCGRRQLACWRCGGGLA
eukprot:4092227-Pleurochrysis_carterae.AAC.1